MPDDRRSANRTRLSGLHATFESADGVSHPAGILDLSRAGLFLKTDLHVPIGKRLSLEMHATGEPAPWPALGRVVWTRLAPEGLERPPGMGIKLIDVDDTVVAAIERLVDLREQTDPGLGQQLGRYAYDQTILGVGTAAVAPVPVATASTPFVTPLVTPLVPAPAAGPAPASPGEPHRDAEPGIAIDLVRRSESAPAPAPVDEPREAHAPPASMRVPAAVDALVAVAPPASVARDVAEERPTPRARGSGWIVAAIVAILAAAGAYAIHGYLQGN